MSPLPTMVRVISALTAAALFLVGNIPPTKGFTAVTTESTRCAGVRSDFVQMMAVVPRIDEWKLLRSGSVTGIAKNHPIIDDGEDITTSPVVDVEVAIAGGVVKTKSGSSYKLGEPAAGFKPKISGGPSEKIMEVGGGRSLFSVLGLQKEANGKSQPVKVGNIAYTLNGKSIGDGKYLLVGKPKRSTSGKSQIWNAFRADRDGNPTGQLLTIKLSANYRALEQESRNYDKVASGLFAGQFVKKIEFLEYAQGGLGFENFSALVIESGVMDLKELLAKRNYRGLEGKAMRDAAAAAAQCIQAMHSSSMVWTDLKTENFIIVKDSMGENGLKGMKGIDLESARPYRSNPVDYSPEACPPEFADAFLSGYGAEFVLGPTYDMWSLGMMLYELSTGQPYFYRSQPSAITTTLRREDFKADVRKVRDQKLRNLLQWCLDRNPDKRPTITQFLLHPFFTTTGIGTLSF